MIDLYPPRKLVAWIDLSTFCNAACPQCHRTDPNGLGKQDWLPLLQWSLDQFKAAFPLEVLHRYDWFEFCGTWGDPVMNKDLFDICKYIIENSTSQVQINTNGSIRDADWWWNLGVFGKDRLHVWFDIDGIDAEMHTKYRQKTDFEKLKENIISYTSTGAQAHFMTVVFMHNEDYLYEIETLARSLGITGLHYYTKSNRFHKGDAFEFVREDGVKDILIESTLDKHPLVQA